MVPKIPLDANHLFLYMIIKHTEGNVDYKALAESTNMTKNAAHKRIARLKKALDSQIGEDGKVDLKPTKSVDEAQSDPDSPVAKRPRTVKKTTRVAKTKSHADDQTSEDAEGN